MSATAHDPLRTYELDRRVAASGNDARDSLADAVHAALLARSSHGPNGLPRTIGRYFVLGRVGAGGMGEVLLAEDTALVRRVAIKLVHAELSEESSAGSSRLLREAQALASVSHPNVLQVFEVGTLDSLDTMRPWPTVYIAMELIDGGNLRDWLARGPSEREVLDALLQAARGLQAVHDVGLVHRDLKPENVLVGYDDRVRLADFGLARLAEDASDLDRLPSPTPAMPSPVRLSGPARLTATGAVIGTPAYMAPEQLRRTGADARSDQYSFCVMAWEALAGKRPFTGKSVPELVEAVRSSLPRLPPRRGVPPRVWAVLRRGLSYEPGDRFPDMRALVHALEHARSRSRRYWPAAAGVGAVALAVALLGARVDDRCANASDDLARAAITDVPHTHVAAELEQHAAALQAARREACADAKTRDDDRLACLTRLDERLATLAEALADGGHSGERAALALADFPDPQTCARSRAAADDPRVAGMRGAIDHAWAMIALGRIPAAEAHRSALTEKVAEIDDPALAAELDHLAGEIARLSGDPVRAREHWLRAATVAEASRDDALAADVWTALVQLAAVELADASAAEMWWRRADAAVQRVGPDARRHRALVLRKAELARLVGDLAGARTELDGLLEDAPSPNDPNAFAWAPVLLARADVAEASGDGEIALAMFRRHRELVLARLGETHHVSAAAHYNVGKAEVAKGLFEEGRASLERAAQIWTDARGPDHPDLALVHVALQELHMRAGSIPEAREHADAALRIRRAALPEDHVDVGLAWLGVGAAAYLQGDDEAATHAYLAALAIHERALGRHHPQTAIVRANLAESRLASDAVASARSDAAQAVEDLEHTADLDPAVLGFAVRVHGSALLAAGEASDALTVLRRAQQLTPESDPLESGIVLVELARAMAESAATPPAIAAVEARARVQLASARSDQAAAWIRRLDRNQPISAQTDPVQDLP